MSLTCVVTAYGASASTAAMGSSSSAMLLPVSRQTPSQRLAFLLHEARPFHRRSSLCDSRWPAARWCFSDDAQRGVDILVALGHGLFPIRQVGEVLVAAAGQAVDAYRQGSGFLGGGYGVLERGRAILTRADAAITSKYMPSCSARARSFADVVRRPAR